MAPTGGAIDMSLSLRMTMRRECSAPALFMASYAMPADIEPSPITAITLRRFGSSRPAALAPATSRSRATAMPRPAEIEVEECAAPKGS
ncbi:hypothetical protein MTDSW087_05908 [Methylobacterium dankookense]|uniref:Uncharacterized protein n=1 Tax=Methylobacterium dankookense TaxID=560405 RepID=A0A564G9C3_9HYPH|nr:hypothetical protein IFDJLNFL_5511 [Methylobacterium dankookense]VUF16151.1 hypothetical protein MTDSW087_05908 [Methylobacterium dankookense]